MKKVFFAIGVVGFKYIARNKVGNGGYEIFCWDLNTKEISKLEIVWYHWMSHALKKTTVNL
jgi:hypothetical protein